jgi:hypothetical protein
VAASCTSDGGNIPESKPAPTTEGSAGGPGNSSSTDNHTRAKPRGWFDVACGLDPAILRRLKRGTDAGRSPDITFLPRRPHFVGGFGFTSHSGPDDYLQRVPLALFGPGFVRSRGTVTPTREVTVADIAPTIAELIDTPFPRNRPGRVIEEALLPRAQRNGRPDLVVTVAWDGGGMNVLEQWPRAWPHLKRLMRKGTSVSNATVGSSPSVTPAVHATIGTGTFPNDHGMVDSWVRVDNNVVDAWEANTSPRLLKTPTLADLYDRREANVPVIGLVAEHAWHFGMIGQGAHFPGGDNDIALRINPSGRTGTNRSYYSLPAYAIALPGLDEAIRTLDSDDGAIDSRWLGTSLDELAKGTPAWNIYQTMITEQILTNEGFGQDDVPDLFFTNYKQLDLAGHEYNMVNREVRSSLEYTDAELPKLMRILDRISGRNNWVMIVTADHGQQPDHTAANAWPIKNNQVVGDLAKHFKVEVDDLIQQTRVTGYWLDRKVLRKAGADLRDVAEFLLDYTIEDNGSDEELKDYRSRTKEHLFEAALPSSRVADVLACAEKRAG